MSTGSAHYVLIPLWRGQGLYEQLLYHQWRDLGLVLLVGSCAQVHNWGGLQWASANGLACMGLQPMSLLMHAHRIIVSIWPLAGLALVHGAMLQRSHLSSVYCCGISAACTSCWSLDGFLPWGLHPAPGTLAAERNSAAIRQLPWTGAPASLSETPGIWIPAVGW